MTPIATRTRVLILQHPSEHGNAIGTAKMAALCLPQAELAVGLRFAEDARVQAIVRDPARQTVLLYPGETSRDLERDRPEGPVTLVVLDGTWRNANALMRENPWLETLPRYALAPRVPSEYRIRREPRANYVSTIEALALALGALEGETEKFAPLLVPFRHMVDVQLGHALSNPARHQTPRKRDVKTLRAKVPSWICAPNLYCVSVEANVLPRTESSSDRHELIHLVAVRVADGYAFEAFVRPEHPISPSTLRHTRLGSETLSAGMDRESFRRAFAELAGGDVVLCAWGPNAEALLRREKIEGTLIEDVSKVVSNLLEGRWGGIDQVKARLGVSHAPRGEGRAGERVGMLVSIVLELRKLSQGNPSAFDP